MPRANSFSDDGRSLTPDLEDFADRRSHEEEHDLPAQAHLTASRRPFTAPIETNTVAPTPSNRSDKFKSPLSALSTHSPQNRFKLHHHDHNSTPAHSALSPIQQTSRYATPRERFRATVRKVMAMHRTSYMLIGAEPGVDPRRDSAYQLYGHIRQKCLVDIVDYSPLRTSFGRMTNGEFVKLLDDDGASRREPWVKVRWINVGGISWDIVSALAIKYNMHPLAVEDLLHRRGAHARSKADYYPKHLFLRVLCHTLGSTPACDLSAERLTSNPSGWSSAAAKITNLPRSSSPQPLDEKLGIADEEAEFYEIEEALGGLYPDVEAGRRSSVMSRKRNSHAMTLTLEELKGGDRVNVRLEPMSIFLYRDGTVISFHPDPTLSFTSPILDRLRQRDTTLRRTADPSLLVQSLLDLIVDGALEVVDEYHTKINQLERTTLIKPKVSTVRALHILSGDLILHKRTLGPIKTLVYGLRRYDVDRCAALVEVGSTKNVVGYMSAKSNIYLADVHDHMEYALTSLDMYASMAENLIGYTFNMTSYQMNDSMRGLTLATIIFFPLTLLTGYFGMNFTSMWSLEHSDLFFWELAIPIMLVVVPLFMRTDIVRMIHYVKKRMVERRIMKENVKVQRHRYKRD